MSNSFYWHRSGTSHALIHMLNGFCVAVVVEEKNGKCTLGTNSFDTLKEAKKVAEKTAYEKEASGAFRLKRPVCG